MSDSKPKILVVDDNLDNILMVEKMLSEIDVEIIRSLSGKDAIERAGNEEFALVLMDVQMPGMDGFETVEQIRKDPANQLLPIIYITAMEASYISRIQGIRTGAVDFLTKPLDAEIFLGKVTVYINLYRQRKVLEAEINRRTEMEAQLLQAKDMAVDAARAKQQFLSTMSHEIRTPLNAIINTAGLLREENPRPDQMENIDILLFSANNLLRLINDILDYSKIDSGKFEFETIDFELRKLINGVRQSFEYEASRKGLELEMVVEDNVPAVIAGDSVRFSQILFNLIGNALKFTDKGKVSVRISLNRALRGITEMKIVVSDTGIGIPSDKQQYIFESFTQASSSTTRKYGGTGLGLAITQKLIELQGGTISLTSEPGKGSSFEIIMKFRESEKKVVEDEMLSGQSFRSLKGLRVLVVEDNLINQKIVMKFLCKWEAITDLADNGQIAVEKVRSNHYDVVLMDLHMPEMNGYDATRTIREMPEEYFQKLPIIALTASAFLEDREKIYEYGMSGYIIKPFNPTELYWKISPYLH